MKKILFVESYPHVMFGQQRILLSLLDACPGPGIEPMVAATAEGPFVKEVRRRAIELIFLPYPELLFSYGGAIYRTKGFRFLRMLWQLVGYIRSIRSKLRSLSLDGVYCNDMRGLLTVGIAARTLGLPVLTWDKLDKPHGWHGWMDWFQLPLVDKNLIISKAVAHKYPKWQRFLMRDKIGVVYFGADLERFDKARSIRPTLGLKDGDIVLAIIGSITPRKGQDRILSIWPDLTRAFPNLRLLVVGAPSGNKEDERFLADLPNRDHPNVQFLGMREDIPDLMNAMDILLVPSRSEGLGIVVAEAMASSRPVIGANTGGIPEVIVDDETGLLVEGEDSQGWRDAINRLAGSPDMRARMGKAGRQRVKKEFNLPTQLTSVLNACVEMTHGR